MITLNDREFAMLLVLMLKADTLKDTISIALKALSGKSVLEILGYLNERTV